VSRSFSGWYSARRCSNRAVTFRVDRAGDEAYYSVGKKSEVLGLECINV
jgi:hypothetical protein